MQKILVVDDAKEWHEIIGIMLREEGYHLSHAYHLENVYSLFEVSPFDLLILDAFLPGLNWWQFYVSTRANNNLSRMRIVMTFPKMHLDDSSARQLKTVIENGDGIIIKPFAKDNLIKVILDVLNRNQEIED